MKQYSCPYRWLKPGKKNKTNSEHQNGRRKRWYESIISQDVVPNQPPGYSGNTKFKIWVRRVSGTNRVRPKINGT